MLELPLLLELPPLDEPLLLELPPPPELALPDELLVLEARPAAAITVADIIRAADGPLARRVGAASLVLLKNEHDVLPFKSTMRSLAVVGPLGDAAGEMRGPWWAAGAIENHVSALAGLRAALPDTKITYAPGVDIEGDDATGIASAVALCDQADGILLCLGEAAVMSGEAASRVHLGLPGIQEALAAAVLARARARD